MTESLIERKKRQRRQLAKLVLEQYQRRTELDALAKRIGQAQNAVELNTSVSAMAETERLELITKWNTIFHYFSKNEIVKLNIRCDLLRTEFEIQTS